jgi:Ankyrin repeats (3 copies)
MTLSISSNLPVISSNKDESLDTSIETFIQELEYQCSYERFDEPDFSRAEDLLRTCLAKADGKPKHLIKIRHALDVFNNKEKDGYIEKNQLLEHAIQKHNRSFALLLIGLKIDEMHTSYRNNDLLTAVENGEIEIVEAMLKNGVSPDPAYAPKLGPTPLSQAVLNNNPLIVQKLLMAGADPNKAVHGKGGTGKTTPFKLAMDSENMLLTMMFFNLAGKKINREKEIQYVISREKNERAKKIDKNVRNNMEETARLLPPLTTSDGGLRCYTTYSFPASRDTAKQRYLDPLYQPPTSVRHLIAPIAAFAEVETQIDPRFAVYVLPKQKRASLQGRYIEENSSIELYFKCDNSKPSCTLAHELCHRALHKMGWVESNALKQEVLQAAQNDRVALQNRHWQDCCPSVKAHFGRVRRNYAQQQHWDEYLVRVPQMIQETALAHPTESRQQIEARIQRDIPNLYRIYTRQFLPQLQAYTRREAGDEGSCRCLIL